MKSKEMWKWRKSFAGKTAALLLGFTMLFGMMPFVVWAEEEPAEETASVETVETPPAESVPAESVPSETPVDSGSGQENLVSESTGDMSSGSSGTSSGSSGTSDAVSGISVVSGSGSQVSDSSSGAETGSIAAGSDLAGGSFSGSLAEDGSSSESTAGDDEDEKDEAEVSELRILIEGKGKVRLTYANKDRQPSDGIVSSDAGKLELFVARGCEVGLAPEADKEYTFTGWKVLDDTVKIVDNKFVMPDVPVQITAVFKDKKDAGELTADGASPEALKELEGKPEKTNAQLIAEQHISPLPVAKADFRFWQTERDAAFVSKDTVFREDAEKDARVVARIPEDGVVFLLEDVDKDWYYAESGKARGFIRKEDLKEDDSRERLFQTSGFLDNDAIRLGTEQELLDRYFAFAEPTVSPTENEAFLYKKCTSYQVVIDKMYALPAEETVNILEEPKASGRVCGVLGETGLAYVIADKDEDWVFVESGDVRGFVKSSEIRTGSEIQKKVEDAGGDASYAACTQKVKPEENEATYYTITTVKEGTHLNPVREAIIKSAEQCLGHPYVWGGTSLLGGCDCSGFVQGLYRMYGYSIPRVAENQAQYGRQIPLDNAQPGDLIFFAQNGYVYHVALYVGDDQTIEAYDSAHGIIRNRVDHAHAVWATHVIDD